MNVIERIQHLLAERGVKPRSIKPTLAKVCGISYEAVRQWFAGDTANIRNENLMAIAEKYEVTVDWLLSGTKQQLSEMDKQSAEAGSQSAQSDTGAKPQATEQVVGTNMAALMRLKGKATPRSLAALDRIEKAAQMGRLKEADLVLLEGIAARFEELNSDKT